MSFNPKDKVLIFNFENEKACEHFKSWLCEQGEQNYWTWMEYREQECKGNITGVDFNYNKEEYIPVKCGRLDKKD